MGAGSGFVLATVWRPPDNAPPGGTRANGSRSEGFGGGCLQLVSESLELHTPEQNTATEFEVPSRFMLELTGASSGDMRLSDHAARSMI